MSHTSAQRKFNHTADEYQRSLVSLIEQFSSGHRRNTVFRDFVELSALAISNSVDRAQFDAREKRYLEIVGKYRADEVKRFPKMLAALTCTFELRAAGMQEAREAGQSVSGLTDVLGETYMMLGLGNDRAGQYFTPYAVSRLMASLVSSGVADRARVCGFERLHEPACGAGGMVIATAEAFHDAGLNYQQAMHATCIDIDPCCVHMAYLQLSLLHIPAIIVHGNALTQEVWGHWFTPAHVLGGWSARLRSRRAIDAMRALVSGNDQEPAPSAVVDIDSTVDLIEPSRGADREDVVALASPPVAAHDVIDLFEDALGVARPNPDIFEKVDQLVLF